MPPSLTYRNQPFVDQTFESLLHGWSVYRVPTLNKFRVLFGLGPLFSAVLVFEEDLVRRLG
jgi:hypothetical protein